jgi:hypothetical protein
MCPALLLEYNNQTGNFFCYQTIGISIIGPFTYRINRTNNYQTKGSTIGLSIVGTRKKTINAQLCNLSCILCTSFVHFAYFAIKDKSHEKYFFNGGHLLILKASGGNFQLSQIIGSMIIAVLACRYKGSLKIARIAAQNLALAVRQARVRFPARHHSEVFPH